MTGPGVLSGAGTAVALVLGGLAALAAALIGPAPAAEAAASLAALDRSDAVMPAASLAALDRSDAVMPAASLASLDRSDATAVSDQERAAAIARPAVVVVEVRWHGWLRDSRTGEVFGGAEGYRVSQSCTGFAVHADGHLVTAGHCVDPGPRGAGRLLSDLAAQDLAAVDRVGEPADAAAAELAEHAEVVGETDGSPARREVLVHRGVWFEGETRDDLLPAEVIEVVPAAEGDVALLKVERGRLSVLEIADDDQSSGGTPVLAIGYPGSVDRVSRRRTVEEATFYEVSVATSGGMSGGPVIDHSGRAIGLLSQPPPGESSSATFVTAASSIRAALERNDVPYQLGPIDRNFQTGLDRYFAGRTGDAARYFDAVLEASPIHQQAAEFRQRAEPGESAPDGGLSPVVAWAIISAVVAVLVGVAAAILFLLQAPQLPSPSPRSSPPFAL
jgi:S1-C subfamily serine protease